MSYVLINYLYYTSKINIIHSFIHTFIHNKLPCLNNQLSNCTKYIKECIISNYI